MKNVLLVALGMSVGLILGWGIWEGHSPTSSSQPILRAPAYPPPNNLVTPRPIPVTVDWQAYNNAREKALRDNPDLAAEYKALLQESSDQQKEIDEAMIKVDPKVAPILAKVETQHHLNGAQSQ